MTEVDSILESHYPLVLHNAINDWNISHWTFKEWLKYFAAQPLKFRSGSKKCHKDVQWERTCKTVTMTLDQFVELTKMKETDDWFYFDYKYLKDCCSHDNSLLNDVNWGCVGFPERTGEDSTLWIGSAGAHTPCHVDTYGCNFVAQLFGKKRWLLFPPDAPNLKPTRIPYEESSVYSSINFYCGQNCNADSLKHAYMVELGPGDVLYVPSNWWHYVENITTAISINTWVPLASDNLSRLRECLVRFLVASLKPMLSPDTSQRLLNPNEDDIEPASDCLEKLSICISQLTSDTKNSIEDCVNAPKRKKQLDVRYTAVNPITLDQAHSLGTKCYCGEVGSSITESSLILNVINSFCNPQNIVSVSKNLLSQHSLALPLE